MLKLLLLTGLLTISSCQSVVLKDIKGCSVPGTITNGGFCATTNTEETSDLTFDQVLSLIQYGNSVIIPKDDYNEMKTELEQACRALGDNCSIETKQRIKDFKRLL